MTSVDAFEKLMSELDNSHSVSLFDRGRCVVITKYKGNARMISKIKYQVIAEAQTLSDALDLAADLLKVHKSKELPKGVKGLLGPAMVKRGQNDRA